MNAKKILALVLALAMVFTLAACTPDPEGELEGDLNNDGQDENCCVIAMNRTFVQENPVHAKKIVQAVQKAHAWMRENPDEATTLLLDRGWNGGDYEMNIMINNSLQFGLAQDFTAKTLEEVVGRYVRLGLITNMNDVAEIMELAWIPVLD